MQLEHNYPLYLKVALWLLQLQRPASAIEIAQSLNITPSKAQNAIRYIAKTQAIRSIQRKCPIRQSEGRWCHCSETITVIDVNISACLTHYIPPRLREDQHRTEPQRRGPTPPPEGLTQQEKWKWFISHRNRSN